MRKVTFFKDDRFKGWQFVSSLVYSNGLFVSPVLVVALTGVRPDRGLFFSYGLMGVLALFPSTRKRLYQVDHFFRSYWKRYREGVKVTEKIKRVLESSGLTQVKIDEGKDENGRSVVRKTVIYPEVSVFTNDVSYYMTFGMLEGQLSKQWDGKAEAFAHALKGDLTHYSCSRGLVKVEVFSGHLDVAGVLYKDDNSHSINIGVGQSELLKWNFDEVPHLLIVGMTGSGKSTFVRNLLIQMKSDWYLDVIDGKYVEFSFLRRYGYNVASDADQFRSYIDKAQKEVDDRFKTMESLGVNNYRKTDFKPYILLVDEFIFVADAFKSRKEKGEDQSERERMFDKLRDIALRGRAAGVFMILILQRPDSTYLPTVIRDNMAKVVLGSGSETAFEMAFGSDKKKLAALPKGMGYYQGEGDVKYFGFANYEIEEYVEDLENQRKILLFQRDEDEVNAVVNRSELVRIAE